MKICQGYKEHICNGKQSNGEPCRHAKSHHMEYSCDCGLCAKYYFAKRQCSCTEGNIKIQGIDEVIENEN